MIDTLVAGKYYTVTAGMAEIGIVQRWINLHK